MTPLTRYGSTAALVVLAVIAAFLILTAHFLLGTLFALAAFGSWFVRDVIRSRRA